MDDEEDDRSHALPRHFREGNRRRYNHKARTAAYKKQKRRLARRSKVERGGRVDLVYSGLLESLVTRHHIVKAFPTRATINLQGPRYVTMRPKDPTKPFKAREIITVRDDERADLDEVGAKELDKQTLKLKSKTKTKKIK